MNEHDNEFIIRLKMLRGETPLSEIAESIKMSKATLSKYENGKIEPGLRTLIKLADYFGVTLDWICGLGERDSIQVKVDKEMINVVKKLNDSNIDVEKLDKMIDVLKK